MSGVFQPLAGESLNVVFAFPSPIPVVRGPGVQVRWDGAWNEPAIDFHDACKNCPGEQYASFATACEITIKYNAFRADSRWGPENM